MVPGVGKKGGQWVLSCTSPGNVVTWEILQQNLSKVGPPLLPGVYLTKWMSCAVKGRHENVYRRNLVTTQMSVNRMDFAMEVLCNSEN